MKRKFRIILVLTLALVMLLSACQPRDLPSNGDKKTTSAADSESGDEQNPSASPTSIGEIKNWKFSTDDIDGNHVDESIFSEARLTMVNIWATWCGPCIAEIPHIGELAKDEFADMNIQVMGIVSDAELGGDNEMALDNAKYILEVSGASYLNVLFNSPDMYESLLKFVGGYPTTIFMDSQGNVVGSEILGMRSKEVFLEEAQQRLDMLND
ncbi:MAG: TlpA family protein disulfide reductase [Clostridiaceae bacterium]|jgi:thiol-disulfide isomerase/thioredoxin|nr:TlpA family protein disulfide reductase [Clostridia bacterium]MBP6161545.1 TlpA family protein disulfide reductase [Clostridia bacterium]MBP6949857.1 TlpA family protein disulfide reductase [Clostridia bacterium]NMA35941.1 TlpA family protein disulfide reductase [Clostridiaceae bacterium]